ncbi:TlpA disulfide reductase family protein [Pedobacter frigoris]|uniref:AhpC/TSA family protein n=1 Tax=Pedobacter frigoris TaxID=2571272 RepID=A0A4U1CL71_9SPHI|nr:TlpA disulfide reductase family protein [Pedobacter frigoris]TKC06189.1 AhpC/TSA family protein [Pedobacter frigoris]
MNLKSIKIILTLSFVSLAGFSQSQTFTVEGNVNRKLDGRFIKLFYENENTKKADSALIKKGTFKLTGNVSTPTVAIISLGGREDGDRIDLFLSEGTIRMSAKDSIHHSNISGTKLAVEHEQLAKLLRPEDDKFFNAIAAWKKMPEGEEKKAYLTKVMSGLDAYSNLKRKTIHQYVKDNPDSYVSLYYLNKNAPGALANYETTYPYYSGLTESIKTTPLGLQLGKRLMATKGKLTGEAYIDFVSTTPDGKQLSLKEIISKNKYTLVDFWASWCGPCRKENPYVVKTFNAFKDKGFTVLSVSLDDDEKKWKDAIEKDGMPWHHVSSLKGWKEPAAALYNVRAIPQNVLVDSSGKIVATNLRAETLYNKVQELSK